MRWGGARIPDRYRWAEWRGRISIVNGTYPRALPAAASSIPRNPCWRAGPTDIGFRSDTYGDADSAVIDVGNLGGLPHPHRRPHRQLLKVGNPLERQSVRALPDFRLGSERRRAAARRERCAASWAAPELFLALERITDAELPREVRGTLEIEPRNGPHGFRPVYFHGRQADDAKVWTSAMPS